jgi:hypothetical protein
MNAVAAFDADFDAAPLADADEEAARLLGLGEAVLERWLHAHHCTPTAETREGFRLLALQRQGAHGQPSFNACRETCRELAYHYNLVTRQPAHPDTAQRLRMMRFVTRHLLLFVTGKLEEAGLGDFCCAARPLRSTET